MRASSGCRAHRWRSMTSRTPLKEVKPSFHRNLNYLAFLFSAVLSSSSSDVIFHLSLGEDPLAGDQNDHDMDSIAGVLKLYFRGLDQALFPKEVFHDLISCVCKFLILLPSLCVFVCVYVSNESSLWVCVPAMESLQERAVHIKKVLQSQPNKTLIIMRYLFAFLHQ